jgi:hypothetical protein
MRSVGKRDSSSSYCSHTKIADAVADGEDPHRTVFFHKRSRRAAKNNGADNGRSTLRTGL